MDISISPGVMIMLLVVVLIVFLVHMSGVLEEQIENIRKGQKK